MLNLFADLKPGERFIVHDSKGKPRAKCMKIVAMDEEGTLSSVSTDGGRGPFHRFTVNVVTLEPMQSQHRTPAITYPAGIVLQCEGNEAVWVLGETSEHATVRIEKLETSLRTLADAATSVVNNWESGDLAGAVNVLDCAKDAARLALRGRP